jgi:starch synthase (maltosyl-transferring)
MSSTTEVEAAVAGTERAKPKPGGGQPPTRIVIQYPTPSVDGGRYPPKRCVGDSVLVEADVFRDGHELLRTVVRYRAPGGGWVEAEMQRIDAHLDGVRWAGTFEVDRTGTYEYTIELQRKLTAGQHDLAGELSEGTLLLRDALDRTGSDPDKTLIEHALMTLDDPAAPEAAKHDVVLGPELFEAIERAQERHGSVTVDPPLKVGRPRPGAIRRLVRTVSAVVGWAQGRREAHPRAGRARLRRRVPGADPPDRPHQPQGARQRARGGIGGPGVAVGDRR